MKDFRRRPEIQSFVEQHTLAGRSASAIIRSMQEEFGRGYRRQDVLADMRRVQQRVLDVERAQKAVPRKYRKELDLREHLLIYKTSRLKLQTDPVELKARSLGTVEQELKQFRQESQKLTGEKVYHDLHIFVGLKHQLTQKLELVLELGTVAEWALVPATETAKILNIMIQFNHDQQNGSWMPKLLSEAASLSTTSSLVKISRRVIP